MATRDNKASSSSRKFVWKKKIERDVSQGVPLETFSNKAEKKRQRERMAEFEKLKKRREERALELLARSRSLELLARARARAEWERKEEDAGSCSPQLLHDNEEQQQQKRIKTSSSEDNKAMGVMEEGDAVFGSAAEINLDDSQEVCYRKPKYSNRVHTGYEWNKYNHTHYDHDNPPPKFVQGYKFNIFYPDLVDKIKPPTYAIENDDDDVETCIIRFHAGPPYQDIAFRIVNKEWDCSHPNGFKTTFERGILRVYFNFKRYRYRSFLTSKQFRDLAKDLVWAISKLNPVVSLVDAGIFRISGSMVEF
ncbi:hypothetical protein ACFE04_020474 [Oxalis oulophora]